MWTQKDAATPKPRMGMPAVDLDEDEFRTRFLQQFADPRFDDAKTSLDQIAAIAFRNYKDGRKAPNSHPPVPAMPIPATNSVTTGATPAPQSTQRNENMKTPRSAGRNASLPKAGRRVKG